MPTCCTIDKEVKPMKTLTWADANRLMDIAERISNWETPFILQSEKNDTINELNSVAARMLGSL